MKFVEKMPILELEPNSFFGYLTFMDIHNYKKSSWIILCKVVGSLTGLIFMIAALRAFTMGSLHTQYVIIFSVIGIVSFIQLWFMGWCVETFDDIRHYNRVSAIALAKQAVLTNKDVSGHPSNFPESNDESKS